MIKAERQENIRALVGSHGSASVHSIAVELGVSEMTIRRDLAEMSDRGELERVHGGALRANSSRPSMPGREYTHAEKRTRNAEEKRSIAERAVRLIDEGQTIFLGTGTTVEQMVPLLPAFHLRIVTNSFSVFTMIEDNPAYELCLIGGTYRPRTSAFIGPLANEAISRLGIDVAFIGANGISDGSAFTSNAEEGCFQQLAFDHADRRYLLADSSKVGKRDFFRFYHLIDVDALVTDGRLGERDLRVLEEHCTVLS